MSVTSIGDSASAAGVRQLRHADAAAERVHQILLAKRAELGRDAAERATELGRKSAELVAKLGWEAAELLTGPPALEAALLSELLVGAHGGSESAADRRPDRMLSV